MNLFRSLADNKQIFVDVDGMNVNEVNGKGQGTF